jgi:PAS domain S-box-containing protein
MAAFRLAGAGAGGNADGGHLPDAEQVIDMLPAAICVCDRDGDILRYNQGAVALFGQAPEPGMRLRDVMRFRSTDSMVMVEDEYPVADAVRTGRALRDKEIVIARPDGSEAVALLSVDLARDEEGAIIGAVAMLVDVTARKASERSAQMLASIVESSEDAIASKDLNGIIATWNRGAERLFGYTAEEAIGRPITMLIPAGRFNEEPEILSRIRRGEQVEHYETVRQRKDGTLIQISLTVSPIRNAQGRIIGASKIARDITERKRIEEHNRLLLREMNHRVKNLFSLAAGVVAISARHADSAKAMAESVRQRIGALARAHALTLPQMEAAGDESGGATTLPKLLETMVAAYLADTEEERVVLSGPPVPVGGAAVTSLALVFHEIATNAAKYGALSAEGGHIAIEWTSADERLDLTWKETGGRRIAGPPKTTGFGTLLADATLGQFGGEITRDWSPDGLAIRLTIPLARLAG